MFIFSSEDSVYQTYFHSKWCSNSFSNQEENYIEHTLIEEFFKKSINNLFNQSSIRHIYPPLYK